MMLTWKAGARIIGAVSLACVVSASAHGAPIRFGEALELSLSRPPTPGMGKAGGAPLCPVPLQDYSALAAQLDSANEMGLPAGGRNPFSAKTQTTPLALETRHDIMLCTALVYAELEGIEARQRLIQRQEDSVSRLMNIEARRVSAEVDHPLLLAEAKMLRARTRMASTALDASEHAMRSAFGSLLGSAAGLPSAVEGSMPPLPERLRIGSEDTRVLQRLLAFRDIVQLEYVTGLMNRQKATHDMALARVSIGALVAAQVEETMKLAALVQLNNQIRLAKIQFLAWNNTIEDWATGKTPVEPGSAAVAVGSSISNPFQTPEPQAASGQSPRLLSILIVPGITELPVGKSQQYSAVVTDSSGHARDVTTDATWICSSDTSAVLSTTGLLTALAEDHITVHVEFQGLSATRQLSISSEVPDESLPY
jgi:hypothetical protein